MTPDERMAVAMERIAAALEAIAGRDRRIITDYRPAVEQVADEAADDARPAEDRVEVIRDIATNALGGAPA